MTGSPQDKSQDFKEEGRVKALANLDLLDTPSEPEFDELVELAAELCGATLSAMTLVDRHHMITRSVYEIGHCTIPREQSFCDHVVRQDGPFFVPDTLEHETIRDYAIVAGGPKIRFYAGHPLRTAEGHAIGALCVMDTQPRELTATQKRILKVLANQLSIRVQMRTHARTVRKLALEVQSERDLFRSYLDSIPVEAYLKDSESRLLFYNKAVADRFEISPTEWLGKTSSEYLEKSKGDQIRAEELHVLATGVTQQNYLELACPDGTMQYWKTIKAPIRRVTGEALLAGFSINMTEDLLREAALQQTQDELEEANRKLRSLSLTDNLTGLWNRRAFDSHLETEVFRAQHGCTPMSLLMIDVDNFKRLNDDFGHSHGDDVLKEVATLLRKSVRSNDVAVRFGGEEFAVVMPGTSTEIAQAVCVRIQTALRQHAWTHREVTVSIGIASCVAGITSDDLLKMADTAMYRAKRSGKDRAEAYNAPLLQQELEQQGAIVLQ